MGKYSRNEYMYEFSLEVHVYEEKSAILPAAFQTLLRDSYRVPINRARVILRRRWDTVKRET